MDISSITGSRGWRTERERRVLQRRPRLFLPLNSVANKRMKKITRSRQYKAIRSCSTCEREIMQHCIVMAEKEY